MASMVQSSRNSGHSPSESESRGMNQTTPPTKPPRPNVPPPPPRRDGGFKVNQ